MLMMSGLKRDLSRRRAELIELRRQGVDITGIDYLEVRGDQRAIDIHFIDADPPPGLVGRPDQIQIVGGRRVVVRVTEVTASSSGAHAHLVAAVDGPGDFSDYVLEINASPQLDEFFRHCPFNFKVGCPARFDCCPPASQDIPAPSTFDIDYMAKDYASFRQALVDLIPRLSPQWTERLAADFAMTVLEHLAYAADQLSYYQDAVANEAFLATARQRISVRRHAKLVDYQMHDGASARTLVQFIMADGASAVIDPATKTSFELLTRIREPIGPAPPATIIAANDRERAVALTGAVFRTFGGARLDWRLNTIPLYDWGDGSCAISAGSTSADLAGDLSSVLQPGGLLLFEEVKSPRTGDPALADPTLRHVVRLTAVEPHFDNLRNLDVTRVTWDPADAPGFPIWMTATADGIRIEGISVARGNLLLADHGREFEEKARTPDPIASSTRAKRFALKRGPLSFRINPPAPGRPAAELFVTNPHDAKPEVTIRGCDASSSPDDWAAVDTLIKSNRFDQHFAVETGNDGKPLIRFGDGVFGKAPDVGPLDVTYPLHVTYRIGIGPQGNIGADALSHVIDAPGLLPNIVAIRNPLHAWGGVDPESAIRVKQVAPAEFRAIQHRAVTEADYASIAQRHPRVRKAVARFRWTGSWHTVFIAIDPVGRLGLSDGERVEIKRHVETFTQAGYDLEIVAPSYVPLRVRLEICTAHEHARADVEQAVRARLTSGLQRNGSRGFFHPDAFTFADPLYLSALSAAVAAIDGVDGVVVTRFARLSDGELAPLGRLTKANLDDGRIAIGPGEILRLDDDPDFPENGILELHMMGGK